MFMTRKKTQSGRSRTRPLRSQIRSKRRAAITPLQIADKVPHKALVFHGSFVVLWGMLKEPEVPQQEMELVTIESLVPEDHLLRKIDRSIDLEFIRERVRHLYC